MENQVLVYLNASTVEKLLELAAERIIQLDFNVHNLQHELNDVRRQLAEAKENQKAEVE